MAGKYKVLIADDEDDIRMIGQAVLMGKGYDVVPAEDGQKAWEAYQEQKNFSVLLTDIDMPRMDGIELVTKIKEDNPNFPIVVFTARDSDTNRELIEKAGVGYFIEKPFENTVLAETIGKALRGEKQE